MKKLILICLILIACEKEKIETPPPTTGTLTLTMTKSISPSGSIQTTTQGYYSKFHSSDWKGKQISWELFPGEYQIFLNHLQVGNETLKGIQVTAGNRTEIKSAMF